MSNSYGWATPTKTTDKGGGGNVAINPDKTALKPGAMPQPWQMPQGSNPLLDRWNDRYGANSPVDYSNENQQQMSAGYANSFAIPYFNAQLADRNQNFNEYNTGRNFEEQVRLNSSQMDLAGRGSNREDLALQYGQQNNVRDYGEAQRQFDDRLALDSRTQGDANYNNLFAAHTARTGMFNDNANTKFANQTNRYAIDSQDRLGNRTADNNLLSIKNQQALGLRNDDTSRIGLANQLSMGNAANATNRYGMDLSNQQQIRSDLTNRYTVDQSTGVARQQNDNTRYGMNLQNSQAAATNQTNRYGMDLGNQQQMRADSTNRYGMGLQNSQAQATNATNRYGMDQNYSLGLGQNTNQAQANAALAQRYQGQTQNEAGANQNALLNIQNQYALGQGGLGFQNRELDTNEAYRRSQLSQEADLTREKFKNDLVQSRYSAFGRAVAPNARALRSWY